MTISHLHHLGLTVADADASASWYSTVLDFRRVDEYTSPETRIGLDHLAFAVGGINELAAWERRLQACDVAYTPASAANTIDGAYVLVFRDPDNIQLELIAER